MKFDGSKNTKGLSSFARTKTFDKEKQKQKRNKNARKKIKNKLDAKV